MIFDVGKRFGVYGFSNGVVGSWITNGAITELGTYEGEAKIQGDDGLTYFVGTGPQSIYTWGPTFGSVTPIFMPTTNWTLIFILIGLGMAGWYFWTKKKPPLSI